MPPLRALSFMLVAGLLVSACAGGADTTPSGTSSPSASATESPIATPSPSASPTTEPTEEPTDSPAPTASPSPSSSMVEGPGGFAVHASAEADSLFLERDTCMNERDNYQVTFPDAWYTNTEIGRNPACVWFSPTDYEVPDPSEVPDEIGIVIEWHETAVGRTDADVVWQEDLFVGAQAATRVEWDDDTYWYVIQLGPSPEKGPNLLVATSTEMGGDYELNRAVMDRMMATIEFFGSVD